MELITPQWIYANRHISICKITSNNMNTIKLNNGVEVPLLGLDCSHLQRTDVPLMAEAFKCGFRLLNIFQNSEAEEAIADGMTLSGISRSSLFLSVRICPKKDENIRGLIMSSLRNLQTNYLDIVLLDSFSENVITEWGFLEELFDEGKIRSIGVVNYKSDQLERLLQQCKVEPVVNLLRFNLLSPHNDIKDWMRQHGIQCVCSTPFGYGGYVDLFEDEQLRYIGSRYNKTSYQVVLRFWIQDNIMVFPKILYVEDLKDYMDSSNLMLEENDMEILRNFSLIKNRKVCPRYRL